MTTADFAGPAFSGALEQFRRELAKEVAALVVEQLRHESEPSGGYLYGREAAAGYLGMSRDALRNLERRHGLKPQRLSNGRLAYRTADLDAFVRGEAA